MAAKSLRPGMVGIYAAYVVCNEAELIAESVRSVKAYVDGFVFVDSAFHANELDATHSTDDTRALAEAAAHPLSMTYVESDRKMELDEARNLSLSLIPKGSWALTIDGDETILGDRHEVQAMFDECRAGELDGVGISVFTAMLRFDGHAPAIGKKQYRQLPVVHTRGVQPRLAPVNGLSWRWTGYSYGLYSGDELLRRPVDPRMVMVNHRTRQTFEAYQSDYIWESKLL